jgi:hypothetical protein
VTFILALLRMGLNMAKASNILEIRILIKANMLMDCLKDMANTFGVIIVIIRVILNRD